MQEAVQTNDRHVHCRGLRQELTGSRIKDTDAAPLESTLEDIGAAVSILYIIVAIHHAHHCYTLPPQMLQAWIVLGLE
jgi:hypothetical protein